MHINVCLCLEFSRRKQSVISALPLGMRLGKEHEQEKEETSCFNVLTDSYSLCFRCLFFLIILWRCLQRRLNLTFTSNMKSDITPSTLLIYDP